MTNENLVWQIAQRDYKFGKGKHSSLTKATYDAVGNKFRSLWGTEAGWAHSVLFTADLRAFSDRVVPKVKVKEEVKAEVMREEGESPIKPSVKVKTEVVVTAGVKREMGEVEEPLFDDMISRVKRKRRQRS